MTSIFHSTANPAYLLPCSLFRLLLHIYLLRLTVVKFNMEDDWVDICSTQEQQSQQIETMAGLTESMADRVRRIAFDLLDLNKYYRVVASQARYTSLKEYLVDEQTLLFRVDFDALSQQDKIDYLMLRNFFTRKLHQLEDEWKVVQDIKDVIPFAPNVVSISDARESGAAISAEHVAKELDTIAKLAAEVAVQIQKGHVKTSKINGYKASKMVKSMAEVIEEIAFFYNTYDPLFDWWTKAPLKQVDAALTELIPVVEQHLVGMQPDKKNEIIGEPIGREALLVELEAEMIVYTPEELLDIADDVFKWCEAQMKTASRELGYDNDWKKALEHVKGQHVAPGEQPHFVKELANEGAEYVRQNNLLTVPPIADKTYRMHMLAAEKQKESPFFLGGDVIMVAYPTVNMDHDMKSMVMRGNNKHFARATAFHELVPGHRMQSYYLNRYNSHRNLFSTAFWMEGWALYWELLLWDRGDFFKTPEDRIGTMFWRMHRCARIIFSLKFHLGQWSPQQCVDLLVDWVGHERANAEAEVRRSFAGQYAPLYQAGYLLGALQIWGLRQEVMESGFVKEKQFHDTILRNGIMPIEMVRALFQERKLTRDYKPSWRFYKQQS